MAKEKNITFSEFFDGFKRSLKTSKSQESKLDTSKLSDDIVGVQEKVANHTKSMLSSMDSQMKALMQMSDSFNSQSLVAAGSVDLSSDLDNSDSIVDGIKSSFGVFDKLYDLVSDYFTSKENTSDEMLKLSAEANKLASDANDLTKDKIRSDLLAEKEREAEEAKKDGDSISSMLKSAVNDSGFFGKIVGIFAFLASVIVGFVAEVFRKIKSLSIVKKILGIFDPVIDFIKGLKTLFTGGAGSMLSKIKDLKLFKTIKTIFKPVTAIFSVVGKAFGFVVSTFSKAFDFIKPVFGFIKELGDGGGKISKFFSSISKFFKVGLKVGSTLAKGIPVIGQVIMVIEGLVGGVIGAFKGFTETEGGIVEKIVGGLKGLLSGIVKGIVGSLVNIVVDFIGFIGGLFGFEDFKQSLYDFDVNKYIDMFFDFLFMPIDAVVDFFSDFTENIKKVGAFFTDLGAGMMSGLRKVGAFFGSIGDGIMNGLSQVSAFFGSIGDGIIVGLDSLSKFFGVMGDGIMNGLSQVSAFFGSIGDGIIVGLDSLSKFFGSMGEGIIVGLDSLSKFFGSIGEGIMNGLSQVSAFFGVMGEGIMNGLSQVSAFFGVMGDGIMNGLSQVSAFFGVMGEGIMNGLSQVGAFFGVMGDGIMNALGAIGSFFSDIGESISISVETAVEMYKQYVMNVWSGFLNVFGAVFDKVGEIFSVIGETFSNGVGFLKELWQSYVDRVVGVFSFVGDIFGKAGEVFSSIGDTFMDSWDKLSSGVTNFIDSLTSGISDIAAKAQEVIKEGLRMIIPDPSKNTEITQPGYWALKAIPDSIIDYAYSETPVPKAPPEAPNLEVSGKSQADARMLNESGAIGARRVVNIVNNNGGNVSNTSNNSQVKNIGSAAAPVSSGSLSWAPQ